MKKVTIVAVLVMAASLLAACSSTDEGTSGQAWNMLTPQQLSDMMGSEDVYLVNVHVPVEGEIPGTDADISYTEIASRIGELPTSGAPKLVIYCRSGNMSNIAAQDLVNAGVTGFYELQGGYTAWQAAGLPFNT
jgi:rhodanese-related sulfurtransferase